ncbi:MAG TPA: helix-hairpin-helix domain-containing protein [Bacillus sp. (in: firmicutes)]|uniref:helix-hairpin-helix domain-containing protein n=1 Tax=Bacillus litorisediminis TaxID=2922713 RepID=UPI001FAF71E2|nr:helix-hairpin-helix domain-containing protein [Bacillus litorisediminis]HWO77713.1 helix-hairpin-helix domain-containing protein [Bacillus sp. (in: firmicutes)]
MKIILENWRRLALLFLILLLLFLIGNWSQKKAETSWNVNAGEADNSPLSDTEENDKVEGEKASEGLTLQSGVGEEEMAVVDIKGAVHNPGVFTVPSDSRLHEVIEKAGGFTAEADTVQVNLALKVWDQMLMYVPKKGESADIISSTAAPGTSDVKKININSASQSELTELTGIGEKKAQAIIEFREKNGAFKTIEDLLLVPGIGEGILSNIREDISL